MLVKFGSEKLHACEDGGTQDFLVFVCISLKSIEVIEESYNHSYTYIYVEIYITKDNYRQAYVYVISYLEVELQPWRDLEVF